MKNLYTILPFYETLLEQNRSKEYVTEDCSLASENNRLLPFVLRRTHDVTGLTNVTLQVLDTNDNLEQNLTPGTFLDLDTGTSYDYLSYNGTLLSSELDVSKVMYLKLFDGTKDWYSETFTPLESVSKYLTLKFSNDTQLHNILAEYEQKIYIDAVLKVPEYPRIDDATEKNGIKIYRSQTTQKANMVRMLTAPEYVVDSLIKLPMMDNVSLTLQNGDSVEIQQVDVADPEFTEDNKGATALFIISLIEWTVIKKLNFTEMGCPTQGAATNIRQGTANITSGVQATVVFSSSLTIGYSVGGTAQDALGSAVRVSIADKTTAGFKVTANKDCTFNWTAIKE